MKKIILMLALSLFAVNSYADEVDVYYTYGTTSQVTSARLNGNVNNILTQVNGNLTNANAATSSGFRFYEVLSAAPSASTEGRMYYNTADDALYISNGTAFSQPGVTAALDNLASVAVNTAITSDTDSTDDLGTTSIYWDDIYVDAIHTDRIGTNTLLVGTGGKDYTTISLALTAASSGDTILVAEGTYTEAITFADDNVTVKALGSAENTIITQAAAKVVDFSTKSGCTLSGFTVSVTAADGATDYCFITSNDATTDDNTVENCIISWASSVEINIAKVISFGDGDTIIRDCIISATNTYAGANASSIYLFWTNVAHTRRMYNNTITLTNSCTGVADDKIYYSLRGTDYVENNTVTLTSAQPTTGVVQGFNTGAGAASTSYFTGNTITVTASSTGVARAFNFDSSNSTSYIIGNSINCTTGDSDGVWLYSGLVTYATGNIVTGDCAYTAAATPYVNANQILETMIFGGGDNIATATEVDAFFYGGIAIGTDNDNNILDDATHGSGVGTLYLGNATVDATFTGFHYYQLNSVDLQAGELVCLKDGKLYRSTIKQDPTAIGLFCGLTNWKDSLGNELVDGEEVDETYYDEKEKKDKIRKKKNYGKAVNKKTNKTVKASDYSYSVAVIGDSMHENDTAPLLGAWVTTDAGNIKNGDYLTSSNKSGYLEKQSDDVMHSYTIGKAREDISKDTKTGYIYLLQ